MTIEARSRGDILLIDVLSPRIDAASAIQFKDSVWMACADGPPRVILNLARVDFIDSSGLGAIVAAKKYLGPDRSLELAGLTPKVWKVFRLTRMDTVFRIHDSADDIFASGSDAA